MRQGHDLQGDTGQGDAPQLTWQRKLLTKGKGLVQRLLFRNSHTLGSNEQAEQSQKPDQRPQTRVFDFVAGYLL